MVCNRRIAFVFWLLLPTLCVHMMEARGVKDQLHKRKRHVNGDAVNVEIRSRDQNSTYCFDAEPCQFGLYKRTHGRMYSFVIIPSWCVCSTGQTCAVDRYDQKKKAEIYTCQNIVRQDANLAENNAV